MIKQRFASQNSILRWAGTTEMYTIFDTVYIVPKDDLFYYFSLDDVRYYNLVMSSERNLAEDI